MSGRAGSRCVRREGCWQERGVRPSQVRRKSRELYSFRVHCVLTHPLHSFILFIHSCIRPPYHPYGSPAIVLSPLPQPHTHPPILPPTHPTISITSVTYAPMDLTIHSYTLCLIYSNHTINHTLPPLSLQCPTPLWISLCTHIHSALSTLTTPPTTLYHLYPSVTYAPMDLAMHSYTLCLIYSNHTINHTLPPLSLQ